jgi:hypothetical protein
VDYRHVLARVCGELDARPILVEPGYRVLAQAGVDLVTLA